MRHGSASSCAPVVFAPVHVAKKWKMNSVQSATICIACPSALQQTYKQNCLVRTKILFFRLSSLCAARPPALPTHECLKPIAALESTWFTSKIFNFSTSYYKNSFKFCAINVQVLCFIATLGSLYRYLAKNFLSMTYSMSCEVSENEFHRERTRF